MTCLICSFFPTQPTNFLRRPIQVATEKISQLMRGKNCPDFYCHFRLVCTPGIQFDHFPKALFSQVSISISIVEFQTQGYKISQPFIYLKIAQIFIAISVWFVHQGSNSTISQRLHFHKLVSKYVSLNMEFQAQRIQNQLAKDCPDSYCHFRLICKVVRI